MKIIQMHNSTPSQMMGFLLVTDGGKLIAVDGGTEGDAPEFKRLVREHGGHIDFWFLTHPHHDHHDVFVTLSEHPEADITADLVCYSPAPADFMVLDKDQTINDIIRFRSALQITPYPVHILKAGESFETDNVRIDVLRVVNESLKEDFINNLSIVFRITEHLPGEKTFKMIFLGDLGRQGGEELLASYAEDRSALKADAVQMAHHGQNGVELPVYEAIAPRYAFWPTPDWLWTNTPHGWRAGSGPWKTLEVRAWMERLGAEPITSLQEHAIFDTNR